MNCQPDDGPVNNSATVIGIQITNTEETTHKNKHISHQTVLFIIKHHLRTDRFISLTKYSLSIEYVVNYEIIQVGSADWLGTCGVLLGVHVQ